MTLRARTGNRKPLLLCSVPLLSQQTPCCPLNKHGMESWTEAPRLPNAACSFKIFTPVDMTLSPSHQRIHVQFKKPLKSSPAGTAQDSRYLPHHSQVTGHAKATTRCTMPRRAQTEDNFTSTAMHSPAMPPHGPRASTSSRVKTPPAPWRSAQEIPIHTQQTTSTSSPQHQQSNTSVGPAHVHH
jgi:hypothetical protein